MSMSCYIGAWSGTLDVIGVVVKSCGEITVYKGIYTDNADPTTIPWKVCIPRYTQHSRHPDLLGIYLSAISCMLYAHWHTDTDFPKPTKPYSGLLNPPIHQFECPAKAKQFRNNCNIVYLPGLQTPILGSLPPPPQFISHNVLQRLEQF